MDASLLDTDILSEVLKQRDPVVQQKALAYDRQNGPLVFSAVTRYEIVRGYRAR